MPDPLPVKGRWWPIGLLFCATVLNYVDRQTLSVLAATLRRELHLTDADYSNAVSAFLLSYGVMYAVGGRWVDRVGVRIGVTACIAWWSVAGMLTGLANGAAFLAFARFLLGIGEPVIYPAGLKASAELFASKSRALAMGVISSGSSVGAILAPPVVAFLALHYGWRFAFLLPGALGLVLAVVWFRVFRFATPAASAKPLPWRQLIRRRDVWGVVAPRLFSDPVWYFYLFWLPDYLQRVRGLSLAEIGMYAWIPFVAADVGAIGGGALSDFLIRRGMAPQMARRRVLYCVAMVAPLGALAVMVQSTAAAILLMSVSACMTQVWAVNIATLGAEVLTPAESASILGLMGSVGSLAGAVIAQVLAVLIAGWGYPAAFGLAAVLHPTAALLLWLGNQGFQRVPPME
ncbi:MAG: MFS transporter [Acidobacteria bacterium]|nr:MFS transporter [Acidobacteriota bacterium]